MDMDMDSGFKPKGYNAVSPYLIVDGAQKMIDVLSKIFEIQPLRRYEKEDGTIMHAEVMLDDSVLMLADSSEAYPANQFLLHVYVPDVRKTFEKAIAAGCEVVEEPVRKKGDPDVRGSFRDFQGNLWAIGTQVAG